MSDETYLVQLFVVPITTDRGVHATWTARPIDDSRAQRARLGFGSGTSRRVRQRPFGVPLEDRLSGNSERSYRRKAGVSASLSGSRKRRSARRVNGHALLSAS